MPKHEHFEELIALAAIGVLPVEEHAELLDHVRGCDRCRRTNEQFSFILDQLPLPESTGKDKEVQELQAASYRQRFLERASAEGVRFTPEALGKEKRRARFSVHRAWPLGSWRRNVGFALASVAALVAAVAWLSEEFVQQHTNTLLDSRSRGEAVIRAAASGAPAEIPRSAPTNDAVVTKLQQARHEDEKRLDAERRELARMQVSYQDLQQESQHLQDRAAELQGKNQLDEEQLGQANTQLEKLNRDNSQLTASLVAQQYRIKELSEQLEEEKASVDRERQLTAAAHDVRELMGARNLHIIDVADLDGEGKSRKSFGRVFYTEGKSLIFYAFDLSQKGGAAKVSFQAWGQGSGESNVKNLGVFHIDDQMQKRWVLRVDDPALLKSVESVFVTVESSPGRDKPLGHRLLYAYLGTQPNHP